LQVAEPVGFEPTVGSTPTQLFESCTFGRSDTVPRMILVQVVPVSGIEHCTAAPAPADSSQPVHERTAGDTLAVMGETGHDGLIEATGIAEGGTGIASMGGRRPTDRK
jgi:hypothetical protein